MSRRQQRAALAIAAVVFFALAISSLVRKSATYDEPVYVVAGLSYLTLHDFTMKEDAPPLVATLAGFSPWIQGLRIPGGRLGFSDPLGREYDFATRVLYRSGLDADRILFWSRLAILVPFGLLLLTSVQRFAADLFGPRAGVFALFLTALSPNLLAHGRLVAADFPCAATLLFASHRLWRFGLRPEPGRALAAGGALGLALVTKFTGLLLLPCFALVLAWVAWERRLSLRRLAAAGACLLAPAALMLCLAYGLPPAPGHYLHGLRSLYRNIDPNYLWYLFGRFHPPGVPYYYPAVLAVKTSFPLLALGLASLLALRRRGAGALGELCLLLPAALLLLASTHDGFSAGVRRVLPVLPVLAVSASRFAAQGPAPGPRAGWRRLAAPGALAALALWHALSSLASWPHYIPYFNEVAGGRANGPNLLDDSNVDFGQDLKALPAVLARNGVDEVVLHYVGTADPDFYGIHWRPLTRAQLLRPRPGVYAVSLQLLIRLRLGPPSWLLAAKPFDRAGTSIWLFRGREQSGAARARVRALEKIPRDSRRRGDR